MIVFFVVDSVLILVLINLFWGNVGAQTTTGKFSYISSYLIYLFCHSPIQITVLFITLMRIFSTRLDQLIKVR